MAGILVVLEREKRDGMCSGLVALVMERYFDGEGNVSIRESLRKPLLIGKMRNDRRILEQSSGSVMLSISIAATMYAVCGKLALQTGLQRMAWP